MTPKALEENKENLHRWENLKDSNETDDSLKWWTGRPTMEIKLTKIARYAAQLHENMDTFGLNVLMQLRHNSFVMFYFHGSCNAG
jgi:hypothetical protein